MLVACSRRLLILVAALSLVCALIASACPTCDLADHRSADATGRYGAIGLLGSDGLPGSEGCACCDTNRCGGSEEPPAARLQRTASGGSASVALVARLLPPPGKPWSALRPPRLAGSSGKTKLHILHAAFLC